MGKTVNVFGRIKNVTEDGIVVTADTVKDEQQNMTQQEINTKMLEGIKDAGTVDGVTLQKDEQGVISVKDGGISKEKLSAALKKEISDMGSDVEQLSQELEDVKDEAASAKDMAQQAQSSTQAAVNAAERAAASASKAEGHAGHVDEALQEIIEGGVGEIPAQTVVQVAKNTADIADVKGELEGLDGIPEKVKELDKAVMGDDGVIVEGDFASDSVILTKEQVSIGEYVSVVSTKLSGTSNNLFWYKTDGTYQSTTINPANPYEITSDFDRLVLKFCTAHVKVYNDARKSQSLKEEIANVSSQVAETQSAMETLDTDYQEFKTQTDEELHGKTSNIVFDSTNIPVGDFCNNPNEYFKEGDEVVMTIASKQGVLRFYDSNGKKVNVNVDGESTDRIGSTTSGYNRQFNVIIPSGWVKVTVDGNPLNTFVIDNKTSADKGIVKNLENITRKVESLEEQTVDIADSVNGRDNIIWDRPIGSGERTEPLFTYPCDEFNEGDYLEVDYTAVMSKYQFLDENDQPLNFIRNYYNLNPSGIITYHAKIVDYFGEYVGTTKSFVDTIQVPIGWKKLVKNGGGSTSKLVIRNLGREIPSLDKLREKEIPTDYQGRDISAFHRMLCLGDSLTYGAMNVAPDSPNYNAAIGLTKYSFPHYLEKMSGVTCDVCADGSRTTKYIYGSMNKVIWYGNDKDDISTGINFGTATTNAGTPMPQLTETSDLDPLPMGFTVNGDGVHKCVWMRYRAGTTPWRPNFHVYVNGVKTEWTDISARRQNDDGFMSFSLVGETAWKTTDVIKVEMEAYDAAIIQLGVNDSVNTLETESRTAFINMINALKQNNKRIKIFLAGITDGRDYTGKWEHSKGYQKDQFIKNLYNELWLHDPQVFHIDHSAYGHVMDKFYLPPVEDSDIGGIDNYNSGHLTAYGYWRLAMDYHNYISWIMHNDEKGLFMNIQFTGTDCYMYDAPEK